MEEEPTPDESEEEDEEVHSVLSVGITEAFRVVIGVGCDLSSTARLSLPFVFYIFTLDRPRQGAKRDRHMVRRVLGATQKTSAWRAPAPWMQDVHRAADQTARDASVFRSACHRNSTHSTCPSRWSPGS